MIKHYPGSWPAGILAAGLQDATPVGSETDIARGSHDRAVGLVWLPRGGVAIKVLVLIPEDLKLRGQRAQLS